MNRAKDVCTAGDLSKRKSVARITERIIRNLIENLDIFLILPINRGYSNGIPKIGNK
jgi:hypothetical protein